jgi:hypothetical protein
MGSTPWNDAGKGGRYRHGGQFLRFDGEGLEMLRSWLKRI